MPRRARSAMYARRAGIDSAANRAVSSASKRWARSHRIAKALRDVAAGRGAEPKNVLGDPSRRAGRLPEEARLEPLAGVGTELVEKLLKVVAEDIHRLIPDDGRVAQDRDVAG